MAIGALAAKRSIARGIPEASSCGMGAMALALPLPARTDRQHTIKGSHKKNDVNAVASKCINLEVFCVMVGRPMINKKWFEVLLT